MKSCASAGNSSFKEFLDIEISISEPRNIDFQVGVDLMDPLQILLRSRKNHQNFEILDFDKKSRNHFKCNMSTFSLRKSLMNVDIGISISELRNLHFHYRVAI